MTASDHAERDSDEELYRRCAPRLIGLARGITLDWAAAEDVVHDVFAAFRRHRGHVDQPEAYLRRSVVNRSLQLLRRRRLALRRPYVDPRPPSGEIEVDTTWSAVVTLPAPQRAVVILRFWEDLSMEQIATTLQIPLGTVKSTLHRALARLKPMIAPDPKES